MANKIISNAVTLALNYLDTEISLDSNTIDTTIPDLTITKSADKTIWINGYLTYTVTITNNTGTALGATIITDVLDSAIAYVADSAVIDPETTMAAESVANTLTITLGQIAEGVTTIRFQVTQA